MWIFSAIANAVGNNFIGRPNYLFDLLFNRVQADGGVTEAQQCTIEELTDLQNDNLLSSASLMLTPSSYKEGKLYSIIPENGDGDFAFTRATTATRVNSDGLVELVPYNLLRYSEQFDNVYWVKDLSSITYNQPDPFGGNNAALCTFTNSSLSRVAQMSPIVEGNTYTLSAWIKGVNVTDFRVFLGTNQQVTVTSQIVNGEWVRVSATVTATITGTFQQAIARTSTTNGESFYIYGAQLVEGTNALPYQKTETRLNIPRIDYSLGGCPSLLVEPQKTNLALQSSSFDDATWTKANSSVTANTTISPSGIQDADTFTGDGVNAPHQILQTGVSTLTSGTTYTTSIYAKKGTNDFIQIVGTSLVYPSNTFANFDLNNGTLGSTGGGATSSITSVGNGWYRCSMTATATATSASNSFIVIIVTSATSPRAESNTLSTSVFFWGAQLEAGAYATSYIPTTTASVTRNADVLTRNNIYTNGFISASGGTWYSHLLNNVPRTRDSGGGVGLRLTNAASNNLFHISTPSGSNQRYWIRKIVGGTNTDLYNTITNEIKVAIKWNGTTADIFVNGVEVVSATAFTSVDLENLNVNNPNIPYSINAMTLWPTPLTDAECIALTTI